MRSAQGQQIVSDQIPWEALHSEISIAPIVFFCILTTNKSTATALPHQKKTRVAQLVELKNGETYNGTLNTIDNWMNLALRDVTLTSSDGKRFWKVSELYVRGNTVKYLQVPDVVLDVVADEKQAREAAVSFFIFIECAYFVHAYKHVIIIHMCKRKLTAGAFE